MKNKLTTHEKSLMMSYSCDIFESCISSYTDKDFAARSALSIIYDDCRYPEIHWYKDILSASNRYKELTIKYSPCLYYFHNNNIIKTIKRETEKQLSTKLITELEYNLKMSLDKSLNMYLDYSTYSLIRSGMKHSLYISNRDVCHIALYKFCKDELGVIYSERQRLALQFYENLIHSCFAVFVARNNILLVEKPKNIEVKFGNIINISF